MPGSRCLPVATALARRFVAPVFLAALAACAETAAAPNIVLVTLDTTRADHLGTYGYSRRTSPVLDHLAAECLVFERCITPMATTLPAHSSLMTATYPYEHGVLANLGAPGGSRLETSPRLRTFAAICRQAGYTTAAFVSAAPVKRHSGIAAGFEHFDQPEEIQRTASAVTDECLAWVGAAGTEPFFLWVHYFDPHRPFEAPEEYGRQVGNDQAIETHIAERAMSTSPNTRREISDYDAEIRFMDAQLGRLLDALRKRPDWDRTVVLVIGDHGEGLSQHGQPAHGWTWDEQLHVPLLMRVPGATPRRIPDPLSTADVLPTLLGLLEQPALDSLLEQATGRDVLAAGSHDEPVPSQRKGSLRDAPGYRHVLTGRRWKYAVVDRGTQDEQHELYDLRLDPHELQDVAAEHPDVVQRLREHLEQSLRAQQQRARELRPTRAPDQAVDPELVEQMKSLGYGGSGGD